MKIKVRPEDFVVKEILKFQPADSGSHVLYRIEKRGWNTLDLLNHVRVKYGLELKHAGLKDRHSFSVQYATSSQDYPVIKGENFIIQKVGYWYAPISPSDIKENAFVIVVRDVSEEKLGEALQEVAEKGFPNYFDEQRFGSVSKEGFPGLELLRGEYEKALFLYFTNVRDSDSAHMKSVKKAFKENWRNWELLEVLAPAQFKPVIKVLKETGDFKKAWQVFPVELARIIVSAFQAYLWNLLLSKKIESQCSETFPIKVAGQKLAASLQPVAEEELPLLGKDELSWQIYGEMLEKYGIASLKLKDMPFYIKSSPRKTFEKPRNFSIRADEDELYPGKTKFVLSFSLSPGAYATMFLKVARSYLFNKKMAGLPGFEPGPDG